MGNLKEREENRSIKMLIVGDSGSGKTGCLFPLAKYFELVYCDFDSGGDIIYNLAKKQPELADNISICSFSDKITLKSGMALSTAQGFSKFTDFLDTGVYGSLNFGPLTTWTKKRILIIDTFNHMGKAALRRVLLMNGRIGKNPQIQDWGQAMSDCESVLAALYSSDIKCHVIVNTHLTYEKNELTGELKGFPTAPGSKLGPVVPTYFNTMIQTKTVGKSRKILTTPQGLVDLKVPILTGLQPDYPVETGMVDLFKALGEIK